MKEIKIHVCTRAMLYFTWGREYGGNINCDLETSSEREHYLDWTNLQMK